MKNIFRRLVSGFSEMKGFDGWLIARVELCIMEIDKYVATDTETDTSTRINTDIVKSNKSHAVLNACMEYKDRQFSMDMLLVKSKGKKSGQQSVSERNHKGYFCNLQYDISDINRFTKEIGDYNYIHHTNNPIVPGLMFFEDMLSRIAEADILETSVPVQLCMLFKKPVFPNEKIYVYEAVSDDESIRNREYMAYSVDGTQVFYLLYRELV